MRILKQSTKLRPRISLILLDWGVRESFHLLSYLRNQSIPREDFEVILVEYYSTVSKRLKQFKADVDTLVVLDMPRDCYYHKHLMYNTGIVLSRGEILMIADSDAMVRPTFLETVVKSFERDPRIVNHMDQFRNLRNDFYPFNYPTFEEVMGDGCINNEGGKTKGILDTVDSIHTRNYGACMSARREDIIAIGGADEDRTYLGHICGPYDMTFRLVHKGLRLQWETDEYLYHTWHPGSDGIDNYLGPHDGRNMSTTALESLCSGRIMPLVENAAIRHLRIGTAAAQNGNLLSALINPEYIEAFDRRRVGTSAKPVVKAPIYPPERFATYHAFEIYRIDDTFYGVPHSMGAVDPRDTEWRSNERVIQADSFEAIRRFLDEADEVKCLETVGVCNVCSIGPGFAVVPLDLGIVDFHIPSQRGNPRIQWIDDLDRAREAALKVQPEARPAAANGDPLGELRMLFEKRLAEMDDRFNGIESGLQGLRLETRESLLQPEERITTVEGRFGGIESALQGVHDGMIEGLLRPEQRITTVEERIGGIESTLQGVRDGMIEGLLRPEQRITTVEERLGGIESALQGVHDGMIEGLLRPEQRIATVEERIGGIESALQGVRDGMIEGLLRPEQRITTVEERIGGIESALQGVRDGMIEGLVRPEQRIATLEERLGSIESGFQGLGQEMREEMRQGLLRPEQRIATMEERFGSMVSGFQELSEEMRQGLLKPEQRIATMEKRFGGMESGFQKLSKEMREGLMRPEQRIVTVEERIGSMESGFQELCQEMRQSLLRPEQRIATAEGRLGGIESTLQDLRQEMRQGLVGPKTQMAQLEERLAGMESRVQGLRHEMREGLVRPEQQILELQRDKIAIASDLDAIYSSRIWRTLTWIGGLILKALGKSEQETGRRSSRT